MQDYQKGAAAASPRTAALRALEETPPGTLGLTLSAWAVAVKLVVRMNRVERRGYVWPRHSTIAADTGLSVRSVQRAIDELVAAGLVLVVSGAAEGRANSYEIDVGELCRRAGLELPEPQPTQRQLGPMLAEVAGKKRANPGLMQGAVHDERQPERVRGLNSPRGIRR